MGLPEDKVKLFEDDPKTPPPTTVVHDKKDATFCRLTCVSLAFLVTFGVVFALVVFLSPLRNEDSCTTQGLFISQCYNLNLILGVVLS